MDELHLQISGGLMGLTISGSIDIDSLDESLREQCHRQLDRKRLSSVGAKTPSTETADGQHYELTFGERSGAAELYRFDDSQAPPELLELMDLLKGKIIEQKMQGRKGQKEKKEQKQAPDDAEDPG